MSHPESKQPYPQTGLEMAIIGMSVRMPGADTLAEFWQLLKTSQQGISHFTDEQLKAAGVTDATMKHPNYVKAKGVLHQGMGFEPEFFDYSHREAELMDPQLRVYHECVYQALADAGYQSDHYEGAIGLYGGTGNNPLWSAQFLSGSNSASGDYQVNNLISQEYFNTRIAHSLHCTGPAITVQTACSSALVAVHLAAQALIAGDCDIAVAGGVEMCTSSFLKQSDTFGYFYQEGMICSPDGACRPFDAKANGTIFSDGAGCVVLKRLEDAIEDNDHIYAVLKGTAINNDGRDKVGFTAPSVGGQTQVIRAAQEMGEVEPETISYIEAHGTATGLGDPIELKALTEAFDSEATGFCRLGSVKSNIGHLGAAAGIAGLIKTVLSMQHHQLPACLHYKSPNPAFELDQTPFSVVDQLTPWQDEQWPLRAGVSAFGIGGTNAHVVVEEYINPAIDSNIPSNHVKAVVLSATTTDNLQKQSEALADYLQAQPQLSLADVEFSLRVGRKALAARQVVVGESLSDIINGLTEDKAPNRLTGVVTDADVVFMFPGQGAQYQQMGLALYQRYPAFRALVDECFALLDSADANILKTCFLDSNEQSDNIDQTQYAQPLLFIVEYALAKFLRQSGVEPKAMVGHSLGEYVAATLAGVFELKDVLKLVCIRGRLMASTAPGSMMAVNAAAEVITRELPQEMSIAAINTQDACVVSGSDELIADFAAYCASNNIGTTMLKTSHAYHSPLMAPILTEFQQAFERVVSTATLSAPKIPYISNLTGQWILPEQATSPQYWCQHLAETVQFSKGLETLFSQPNLTLIEVGPGRALSRFAQTTLLQKHSASIPQHQIIQLLPSKDKVDATEQTFVEAIGRLFTLGHKIQWPDCEPQQQPKRVPLPGYQFSRDIFYVPESTVQALRQVRGLTADAKDNNQSNSQNNGQDVANATNVAAASDTAANWFYQPVWQMSPVYKNAQRNRAVNAHTEKSLLLNEDHCGERCCVIFADTLGVCDQLSEQLQSQIHNYAVIRVFAGREYRQLSDNEFQLVPAELSGYQALFNAIKSTGKTPSLIIHGWNITASLIQPLIRPWSFEPNQLDSNLYSLLYLCQALGTQGIDNPLALKILSNNAQYFDFDDQIHPAKATISGMCGVISAEHHNISCQGIDLCLAEAGSSDETRLIKQLLSEVLSQTTEPLVCLRGNQRWYQRFEAMPVTVQSSDNSSDKPSLLQTHGVYIISGGLGGIGLSLAQVLAETVQAKIILLGRSDFPPPQLWDSLTGDDVNSQKVSQIRQMQALGAEVMTMQVDVADSQMVQQMLSTVKQRFGQINGFIHAAGVAGGGLMALKTAEMMDKVIRPKIHGTAVLIDALAAEQLDFFINCSSISSLVAGIGQFDYSAANAFLDATTFVNSSSDAGSCCRYLTINWNAWAEVGMAVNTEISDSLSEIKASYLANAISTAAGQTAFKRLLHHLDGSHCAGSHSTDSHSSGSFGEQVVVSTNPLDERLMPIVAKAPIAAKTPIAASSPTALDPQKATTVAATGYSRPALDVDYVAPVTDLELELADIWRQLLGIDLPGINDKFFELGGDSLLLSGLVSRINQHWGINYPIKLAFEHPTIAQTAACLIEQFNVDDETEYDEEVL